MSNSEILYNRFDKLVREIATRKGMRSKAQLISEMKTISNNALSRIISGHQKINDLHIMELLTIEPDINLNWLFKGTGEMFEGDVPSIDTDLIDSRVEAALNKRGIETDLSKINDMMRMIQELTTKIEKGQ